MSLTAPASAEPSVAAPRRHPDVWIAATLGLVATAFTAVLSWNPSFWGDEAASVMSAQRSLPSLFAMLQNVDAVHGAYYLFLHFWITAFGISEFAVRLPSAIAVGLATAGVVVLAARLATRRVAIIAGIICIVLPRFTLMGIEGRSYALSAAVAVWLTVLLVCAASAHRRRWLWWSAYALGAAAGTYLFLYLALVVLAHGIAVVVDSRSRQSRTAWLAAAGAAALLTAPIFVAAIAQRDQIAFLGENHALDLYIVFVTPWFGNLWLAIAGWLLIIWAAVVAVRNRRSGDQRLALISALWLLVPLAFLLLVTVTVLPIYNVRYISLSAPAAAILVAVGIDALTWRAARIAAVALIVLGALPTWSDQRGEFAKDGGSDWRQVSDYLGEHARAGDAIYFDPSAKVHERPRLAMHLYPADYAGLMDVALTTPFDKTDGLWDEVADLKDLAAPPTSVTHYWVVGFTGSEFDRSGERSGILAAEGFRLSGSTQLHRTTVYEYTR